MMTFEEKVQLKLGVIILFVANTFLLALGIYLKVYGGK